MTAVLVERGLPFVVGVVSFLLAVSMFRRTLVKMADAAEAHDLAEELRARAGHRTQTPGLIEPERFAWVRTATWIALLVMFLIALWMLGSPA